LGGQATWVVGVGHTAFAGQSGHALLAPVAMLYCPIEHSEHLEAPVDEKEPAVHSKQADALAEAENEPAAHWEQPNALPFAEKEPGVHTQSSRLVAPVP
jgi:hypothetical protein